MPVCESQVPKMDITDDNYSQRVMTVSSLAVFFSLHCFPISYCKLKYEAKEAIKLTFEIHQISELTVTDICNASF